MQIERLTDQVCDLVLRTDDVFDWKIGQQYFICDEYQFITQLRLSMMIDPFERPPKACMFLQKHNEMLDELIRNQ